MNPYGAKARNHWHQHLPSQYAQIQDPETFFTTLGEQIQAAIEQQTDLIAGEDPPGETFMAKLGRLNEAKLTAEDEVLREMLPEAEDDMEQPEDPQPTTAL